MSCHHIDFVAFDLSGECHLRPALDDPFPELRCHDLDVVGIQIEFLSDLFIGQVQPHEVQAEDPEPQWLMMTGKDRPGEVVELPLAALAVIALPRRLGLVATLFSDLGRGAVGAGHAVGPTEVPDGLEALGVVDEVMDVEHQLLVSESGRWRLVAGKCCVGD
jgi:hypothetical protein